jgi:hypothetical protein
VPPEWRSIFMVSDGLRTLRRLPTPFLATSACLHSIVRTLRSPQISRARQELEIQLSGGTDQSREPQQMMRPRRHHRHRIKIGNHASEARDKEFWNPDKDPRGMWRRSDLTERSCSRVGNIGHFIIERRRRFSFRSTRRKDIIQLARHSKLTI